ncbi:MAG: phosphopantothenoylcysteine decarboxylase, partial [Zestosphaera sp.]
LSEVKNRKYDVVVLAAAPADFRFKKYVEGKIKSEVGFLSVELEATPKISLSIRKEFSGLLVGFAAEAAEGEVSKLAELALEKLEKRSFDVIVANDISRSDVGFAVDYNEVLLISKKGRKELVSKSLKEVVARKILDLIKEELRNAY